MEKANFGLAFLASGLILIIMLVRIGNFFPVYVSSEIRNDLQLVLKAYRRDSGIGLSNLNFKKISCRQDQCDLFLDFRYHGRPFFQAIQSIVISWPMGQPHLYVIK